MVAFCCKPYASPADKEYVPLAAEHPELFLGLQTIVASEAIGERTWGRAWRGSNATLDISSGPRSNHVCRQTA